VQLFHYHLVTSKLREVESRYIGKLGFRLIARYGRIGDEELYTEGGISWEELDRQGFKLRLTELERGAINVVVQPGQWELPRVDHLGFSMDEDEFAATIERAQAADLRIQEHGGKRTFVTTGAGYRLEIHPPREWIEELLGGTPELRLAELQLRSEKPEEQAAALAKLLDLPVDDSEVEIGQSTVRFVPGGPSGRPELHGEFFA
jgi:catechol 2,3-dioxygenase-like lactoylglutathione lyase family enzyme